MHKSISENAFLFFSIIAGVFVHKAISVKTKKKIFPIDKRGLLFFPEKTRNGDGQYIEKKISNSPPRTQNIKMKRNIGPCPEHKI